MSKAGNENFCHFCDLGFKTSKQFVKHSSSDEHVNRLKKRNGT